MAPKRAASDTAGMKRKAYEKELRKLQVELCHLQDWVKDEGARIIVVFEGRDAAGKGGTIKARACFAWWRFPLRRTGKRRKCSCSATSSNFRPRARS